MTWCCAIIRKGWFTWVAALTTVVGMGSLASMALQFMGRRTDFFFFFSFDSLSYLVL
jgi:hypothetical protein